MTGVVVVLVVVVLVTVINFFLLLAILRRMAVHQRRLDEIDQHQLMSATPDGLPAGLAAPPFSISSADGRVITEESFQGPLTAVAFFSTSCRSCLEHAPEFVGSAQGLGADAWAVVVGPETQGSALRTALGATPTICVDAFDHEMVSRYAVDTFPTFYLFRDGVVAAQVGSAGELVAAADSPRVR